MGEWLHAYVTFPAVSVTDGHGNDQSCPAQCFYESRPYERFLKTECFKDLGICSFEGHKQVLLLLLINLLGSHKATEITYLPNWTTFKDAQCVSLL